MPPTIRARRARCFNGAADGDRRRAAELRAWPCRASKPASTEPPTVIGGELHHEPAATLEWSASTEPPTVIGGEALHQVPGSDAHAPASTEPPTVIGGESRARRRSECSAHASTEPPTVIGGEGAENEGNMTWKDALLQRSRRR